MQTRASQHPLCFEGCKPPLLLHRPVVPGTTWSPCAPPTRAATRRAPANASLSRMARPAPCFAAPTVYAGSPVSLFFSTAAAAETTRASSSARHALLHHRARPASWSAMLQSHRANNLHGTSSSSSDCCRCASASADTQKQHGEEDEDKTNTRPERTTTHRPQRGARRAVAKQHAAAAMRGLSDTAWCAVLTELGRVCCADAVGGVAEAWIAFGGLTGVWTAALVVRAVREQARRAADAARDIVDGWDRSFLYDQGIAEDDVFEVVAWMEALDELESTHGAALLWEMAGSSDPRKRRAVAEVLGECGVQSNVVIGVVVALTDDDAQVVSCAANEALLKLVGDVCPTSIATVDAQDGILASLADQEVAAVARARAQVDAVLFASGNHGPEPDDVALSITDRNAPLEQDQPAEIFPRRLQDALHVQAPLFDWLAMSELRTLCVIATLPLCYEAFCLGGGADGWLRFVGLGWLMSVAGLVAYPQSNWIWKNLEQVLAEDV